MASVMRTIVQDMVLFVLCAGLVGVSGCSVLSGDGNSPSLDDAGTRITSADRRIPVEFRDILARQDQLYNETKESVSNSATRAKSLSDYAVAMRGYNDKLTSILAEQIMVSSAAGPPIKRINAWSSISGILGYTQLSKLKGLDGGKLSEVLDARYKDITASGDLDAATRLLHIDMRTLKRLLDESIAKESSQNVRSAAKPVLDKLAAAMMNTK